MRKIKLLGLVLFCVVAGLAACNKTSVGATGATGTANVLYANWNTLAMTYNSTDSAYEQTITADSITQSVLDSGLVLSYIKYTNSAGAQQVENADSYMETVLGLKSIFLYSYLHDFSGVSYRYIVIHGGTAISGRAVQTNNTILGYTAAQWRAMAYDKAVAIINASSNTVITP